MKHELTLQLNMPSPVRDGHHLERGETLLHALQSTTQTTWRWAGANVAVERVAPYRVVVLGGDVWRTWRDWRDDLSAPECELAVEVHTPLGVFPEE